MLEGKKEDNLEKQKQIMVILNKPWARKMLTPYMYSQNSKNIQRFTDFKKILKANPKTVNDHINELLRIGILKHKCEKRPKQKKKTGYVIEWKNFLNYVFRFQDIKLIEECPIDNIYFDFFHYDKSTAIKYVTIYGLHKHNSQVEKIVVNTYKKLIYYFNTIYVEKLNSLVSIECKKIKNNILKKSVKQWCLELTKKYLLYPPRNRGENKAMPRIKYVPPKELEQEFKVITEKIWNQLNKEFPPIGIMIQF